MIHLGAWRQAFGRCRHHGGTSRVRRGDVHKVQDSGWPGVGTVDYCTPMHVHTNPNAPLTGRTVDHGVAG